ncbi:phosphate/phosphite/phosphonate ABC transporter substrate-binding protein [Phenylobacterium sp.]|uniref:phosphate/phosphite/phosphonate ABC transporter substrate-binding protein n=1 Tax=Phenylobacterium sp. TaxID=1871053 RepID=UPI0035AEB3AA
MRAAFLAAAALALAPALARAEPLRLAVLGAPAGACHAVGPSAPAGERAYFDLLTKRLGQEVQACPEPDAAAAAKALAGGKVDMAPLDPAAFAAVAKTDRAILTVRPKGSLNRIPVVVAVKADSPRKTLADLKGGAVAFGGVIQAAYATPRMALADQGADPAFFSREDKAKDAEAAAADLRAGKADALALNAASWQRLCRGDTPGEDRCTDLKEIWRGRPRAKMALVVARDMPLALRYRIIGIHVAMHLEAPQAFAWASSFIPNGEEFEPTEADALIVTTQAR